MRKQITIATTETLAKEVNTINAQITRLDRRIDEAGGGGSTSGTVANIFTGELGDTSIEIGTFENAAAGWNSFEFREPFDDVPVVTLTVTGTETGILFEGVIMMRNVTRVGFQYQLKIPVIAAASKTTADKHIIHYIAIEDGGER